MANPYVPTLTAPSGGENLLGGNTVSIKWTLPAPDSPDGRPVQVEIFYTDNYSTAREPDWQQIAVVPDTVCSYIWTIPSSLHSPRCRCAVRTRNSRGERSYFSVSAANFFVSHHKLLTPAVISPVENGRYDKYVEIAPDYQAIAGSYSQRSLYQFYYSSASLGTLLTPIVQNIPIGTKNIIWNTIDVPPANDYVVQVYVQDDDNNTSDPLLINNITIAHEGFFLIDTTPPVASIIINDNAEFTQTQDVTVNIVSYDETTGVQSMQIIEGTNIALPEPVANVRPFTLSTNDGTKTVELLLQDFGGNRNNNFTEHSFELVLNESGVGIADIAFDTTSVAWVVTNGASYDLYSIDGSPQNVFTFINTPTAVCVFNAMVYVATKTAANTGTLFRYSGSLTVDTIYTFTAPDSVINCIVIHGNKMYVGFENGNVYSYDGTVLVNIATVANPVSSLMSDKNSLYLAMENDDNVYIFNGSTFVQTGV